MPATVMDGHPGPGAASVAPCASLTATFTNLMNGLAYGLGWTWAEPHGAQETTS